MTDLMTLKTSLKLRKRQGLHKEALAAIEELEKTVKALEEELHWFADQEADRADQEALIQRLSS